MHTEEMRETDGRGEEKRVGKWRCGGVTTGVGKEIGVEVRERDWMEYGRGK